MAKQSKLKHSKTIPPTQIYENPNSRSLIIHTAVNLILIYSSYPTFFQVEPERINFIKK